MMIQGPPPQEIKSLFSAVAHKYDRANDAMTLGLVRLWRRKLVVRSGAKAGDSVLDCATGTGDLALEFKKTVGEKGQVLGMDFCAEMLAKAPAKAAGAGLPVEFQLGDVLNLPFADRQFDVSSIAYGIRNVSDPQRALCEMARVVKPGGRVMVLETGDASGHGGLGLAIEFYVRRLVPRIGGWVTGRRFAYEYLSRSSRGFPSRDRFIELMESTGRFAACDYQVMMLGASFLYRGVVK